VPDDFLNNESCRIQIMETIRRIEESLTLKNDINTAYGTFETFMFAEM